ncbi:Na+/H+ antiporter subunit E [Streptomyces sp. NPDC101219]|uniref:Na+/H+ antiporter subunit E n=1 Tax=Streptomyces sp. NPDC101219 TaxID=3366131 RepID=UPI003830F1C5
MSAAADRHGRRARPGLRHLPMIIWLWLLWLLLWGTASAVVVAGGLLVAVGVVLLFPLPAVLPGAVPDPLRIARLMVHVLTDLVKSGCVVAWQVVRHGRRASFAIVEVPLRLDSDLLIAAVAEFITMSPGSVVVEIDRRRRCLYVHALLPHGSEDDIARRRADIQALERRVARAVRYRHDTGDGPSAPAPPEEEPRDDARGGTS